MQESPALQYSERTQMSTGVTGHPTPLQINWRVTSFRLILHLCRLRSLTEPIEFKPELCGITTHNCQHWNSSYRATFLNGAHCSLSWCIQQLGQLGLWLYRWLVQAVMKDWEKSWGMITQFWKAVIFFLNLRSGYSLSLVVIDVIAVPRRQPWVIRVWGKPVVKNFPSGEQGGLQHSAGLAQADQVFSS